MISFCHGSGNSLIFYWSIAWTHRICTICWCCRLCVREITSGMWWVRHIEYQIYAVLALCNIWMSSLLYSTGFSTMIGQLLQSLKPLKNNISMRDIGLTFQYIRIHKRIICRQCLLQILYGSVICPLLNWYPIYQILISITFFIIH